jgi:hypothetical protein
MTGWIEKSRGTSKPTGKTRISDDGSRTGTDGETPQTQTTCNVISETTFTFKHMHKKKCHLHSKNNPSITKGVTKIKTESESE